MSSDLNLVAAFAPATVPTRRRRMSNLRNLRGRHRGAYVMIFERNYEFERTTRLIGRGCAQDALQIAERFCSRQSQCASDIRANLLNYTDAAPR